MYTVGQNHHDRRMPARWICSIHNLRHREGHAGEQGANIACVCAVRTSMPGQGMVLLVMKLFRPGAAGTFQTMAGVYRENYLDFAPLPRVHRGSPATIAWHTLRRSPILPFPAAESCTALGLSAMGWPAVCGSMRSYGAGGDHECLPKIHA